MFGACFHFCLASSVSERPWNQGLSLTDSSSPNISLYTQRFKLNWLPGYISDICIWNNQLNLMDDAQVFPTKLKEKY